MKLTTTRIKEGVWQGIVAPSTEDAPPLEVTHQGNIIADISLQQDADTGHWYLSVPIPPSAISEGVQTLIVRNTETDAAIGHLTLMAGEVLGDDIRAEMDLLRAELDMLKRAFRRHCTETA